MNGVNYAEALVKARRYEIATESTQVEDTVVEEDTTMVAEGVKEFIGKRKVDGMVAGDKIKEGVKKAVTTLGQKKGEHDFEAAKKTAGKLKDARLANAAAATMASKAKNDTNGAAFEYGKEALKGVGKKAAIGAGVAAAGAAAAIAAKKIADKKKAAKQNQEEVKENYEYEEYETLVENVIGYFMSEEEIMSENASEIATTTADYFIENIDNM